MSFSFFSPRHTSAKHQATRTPVGSVEKLIAAVNQAIRKQDYPEFISQMVTLAQTNTPQDLKRNRFILEMTSSNSKETLRDVPIESYNSATLSVLTRQVSKTEFLQQLCPMVEEQAEPSTPTLA